MAAWCDAVGTHLLIADDTHAPVFSAAFDQFRHMSDTPFLSIDPSCAILPSSWGQGQGQGPLVDFKVYQSALIQIRDADRERGRLGEMGLLGDHQRDQVACLRTQRCLYQHDFSCGGGGCRRRG